MKDTTTPIGAPELATQARLIEMFEQDLGYEFLGNKTDEDNSNIIPELLRANLLNRKDKEGKPLYSKRLADAAIVKLQSEAKDLSSGLYAANKAVYSILKYGAKVQDEKGAIKTVMLIDWDIVTNNDFQIARESPRTSPITRRRCSSCRSSRRCSFSRLATTARG